MPTNSEIAKQALDLLSLAPQGAGFTLLLGGGPQEWQHAQPDPFGFGGMLAAAGALRFGEDRFAIDLHVYVDDRDGRFHGRVTRVTGVAHLATIPDPSEMVASFDAASAEEAATALSAALDEKFPNTSFAVRTLFYRQSDFTVCELPKDRQPPKPMWWQLLSSQPSDAKLADYINGTVDKALAFGAPSHKPSEVQLWFSFGEQALSSVIYATMTQQADGSYAVAIKDHACWPWRDKAVAQKAASAADVKSLLSGYIVGTHGYEFDQCKTYLRYTVGSPAQA